MLEMVMAVMVLSEYRPFSLHKHTDRVLEMEDHCEDFLLEKSTDPQEMRKQKKKPTIFSHLLF